MDEIDDASIAVTSAANGFFLTANHHALTLAFQHVTEADPNCAQPRTLTPLLPHALTKGSLFKATLLRP